MGITVFLPLEYHNIRFSERVLFQSLEIFLFVIALTLPFEIRDLKYDELELKTIPQKLGVRNTKWFGTVLLMISGFLAIQQNYIDDLQLYCSLLVYLITLAFLWFSKVEQGRYYASFWVEGIPVLWLLLYLLV
jgi:4-hydroxybenzoate polyprenyltransferase